jgi:murein DD-endopeptidase MepM/ murein hydrolase activator NlpD
LPALASRFDVETSQISASMALPDTGYLAPGLLLTILNTIGSPQYPDALLPDSEVIYSLSTRNFDPETYIQTAGGYLSLYTETVGEETLSGAEIIQRIANETSANPRLLLAFLEHRSHWVFGQPTDPDQVAYPIGFFAPGYQGLYKELTLVANHVNIPFYDWRIGRRTYLTFKEGQTASISPALNAGTVALQTLFSKFYEPEDWWEALYGQNNFSQLHSQMFGDPWTRAADIEPLLHPGLSQPILELPFSPGEGWSFTGGPHKVLNLGSPLGALDFGPVTGQPPCVVSTAWVTASASGLVTRAHDSAVVIDLDGDGLEQTGWVLFYLHIAEEGRIEAGTQVNVDDPIGHPSCEGGTATGTHVHFARKYNGEWLAADGPLPFILSGWEASMGERAYQGALTKGRQVISASPGGSGSSIIIR